jgi:hypothetical protein
MTLQSFLAFLFDPVKCYSFPAIIISTRHNQPIGKTDTTVKH